MPQSNRFLPLLLLLGASVSTAQLAAPDRSLPGPQPDLRIANLGRAGGCLGFADGVMLFAVNEFAQGETDLSGDGDCLDTVLHLRYAATGRIVNTGFPVTSAWSDPVVTSRYLFANVSEGDHGDTDLNGDGDANDTVLVTWDVVTGAVTNSGVANRGFSVEGTRAAILAEEEDHGADLNGDRDLDDRVLHLHDATSGVTRNIGMSCPDFEYFILRGDVLAFLVDEWEQGQADRNGDGDIYDNVVGYHVISANSTYNTALCSAYPTGTLQNCGNLIVFAVQENGQGYQNLNGDGDTYDSVLHVVDPLTGTAVNVGIATSAARVEGDYVCFAANEIQQGVDYNSDGDASDQAAHVFRVTTSQVTNLGVSLESDSLRLEGGYLVFNIYEPDEGGTDLNGDGDIVDWVLHTHDVASGLLINSGIQCEYYPQLAHGRVLFRHSEYLIGTDLNGDGDSQDLVAHVYEVSTGNLHNLGIAVQSHVFPSRLEDHGSWITCLRDEFHQGESDANGDGDALDLIPELINTTTWARRTIPIAAFGGHVGGGLAAYSASEPWNDDTDFNADGDADDVVLFLVGL